MTLPPPWMSASDVQLLLDSFDRSTLVGVRDFTIVMLVARLELWSLEVARMELRHLDWCSGDLMVRGKSGRRIGVIAR